MRYPRSTSRAGAALIVVALAGSLLLGGCREESDEQSTTPPVGSPAVATRTGSVDATDIGDVLKSTAPPPEKSSAPGHIGPPATIGPPAPAPVLPSDEETSEPPDEGTPPPDRDTP